MRAISRALSVNIRNLGCRSARPAVGLALVLAGGLLVAACDKTRELETAGTRTMDAGKLHPISAEWRRASFEITDAHRAKTWTGPLYFDVTRFVRQYGRDGRGPLDVAVPRGGSGSTAVATSLQAVRQIAQAAGVAPQRLRIHERSDRASTVTLSFQHIAANAPDNCADWSDDIKRRIETGPYRNFGCATQRNLANMVADPTDLVVPTAEADRNSDRRSIPYKAYTQRPPGLSAP